MSGGPPAQPPGAERRRAPRFRPDQLGVEVSVVGARLLSIGAYGLMIEAPIPLSLDSSLRLHIVVGGRKGSIEGRVRDCVPRSQGRSRLWNVGVEFEAMPAEDRERLSRALASRGGSRP